VFTARYGLIPYIPQITFSLSKVKLLILTESMEQDPVRCQQFFSQQMPPILWNEKVHYRIHNSPPLILVLSQINPVDASQFYFFATYFRITLPSVPRSSTWSAHYAVSSIPLLPPSSPPSKPKYSPQHPILEDPHSMFLSQYERPREKKSPFTLPCIGNLTDKYLGTGYIFVSNLSNFVKTQN
jgi:hypothetical protein